MPDDKKIKPTSSVVKGATESTRPLGYYALGSGKSARVLTRRQVDRYRKHILSATPEVKDFLSFFKPNTLALVTAADDRPRQTIYAVHQAWDAFGSGEDFSRLLELCISAMPGLDDMQRGNLVAYVEHLTKILQLADIESSLLTPIMYQSAVPVLWL